MATRRIDPSADRGRVAVCFDPAAAGRARPRCVAKVNRRGSAGGFHRDRQSKAVTANSGRVASGHGVVASGHGVAKYAMLPPVVHRAVLSMCAPAMSTRTLSLTLLSRPRGFPRWVATGCNRYGTPYTTAQYSTAPHPITSPGAAGDRAGPVQRRSALVHARSSCTLRARSRSELVHARRSFTLRARSRSELVS